MNRIEVMSKVREVLDTKTADPADELIALGQALVGIGKALKGQSSHDARAILRAVSELECGNPNRN